MTADERVAELERLAAEAHEAERTGHAWAAGEVWKRYVLVRDAGRDPDELLAEGVELSRVALDLARQAERSEL
ncbi:MAG: hypothetical protein WKF94_02750 [Solirubrobacteraceae bacterium]